MKRVYKSYIGTSSKLSIYEAGVLAVFAVVSNLLALHNRLKWIKSLGEEKEWIFTKSEWDQASREDRENVTSIFIDLAILFWIFMSILWMFELPGANTTFIIGLMFIIASSVISKMNGSSWNTPFTRFRRK